MNKKVSPLGVLIILAIAFALWYFGWPLLTGARGADIKPPFSQEELGRAIVHSFATDNKIQFSVAVYGAMVMEQMYKELLENAEPSERNAIEEAHKAELRRWSEGYSAAMDSWERIDAAFDGEEQATLEFDNFDYGAKDCNHVTGMVAYERFTINMHSDSAEYVLDVDRMIETPDGWKIAGKIVLEKV